MKNLTKTGENFIRTICSGTSTSLLSGNYKYNLPFSTLENTLTTFSAIAFDQNGDEITSNSQLGEALIYWFNKYAELNNLDANVLASQAYESSKYNLWHYGKNDSASGISGFISIRVFRNIINSNKPETIEGMLSSSAQFSNDDVLKIQSGLTNPNVKESYIYRGFETTQETSEIAIQNRVQLHQNIINNPEIMIKAQSNLFKEIAKRNNGILPNTLFAYNRNYNLSGSSYNDILFSSGRKYGNVFVKDGIDYVERVFGYLGDKDNAFISNLKKPRGLWFGYEIDFTQDNFNSFLG